jgi:hypothetical protein
MGEGTLKIVMCAMLKPFTRCVLTVGHYYGFFNISCLLVFVSRERRHVGNNVSLFDTLFNTVSGHIRIGDKTIFGHNCMVAGKPAGIIRQVKGAGLRTETSVPRQDVVRSSAK